jgi:hypothetical protein
VSAVSISTVFLDDTLRTTRALKVALRTLTAIGETDTVEGAFAKSSCETIADLMGDEPTDRVAAVRSLDSEIAGMQALDRVCPIR